jgi:hypothetical protein
MQTSNAPSHARAGKLWSMEEITTYWVGKSPLPSISEHVDL